jgi:hypothetical protein
MFAFGSKQGRVVVCVVYLAAWLTEAQTIEMLADFSFSFFPQIFNQDAGQKQNLFSMALYNYMYYYSTESG